MPKFIVSTSEDGKTVRNDEALEFPSEKAVTDDAQNALADMAKEKLPNGSHAEFHTVIEDEAGERIYRASLTFDADSKADLQKQARESDEAADEVAAALDAGSRDRTRG